MDNSNGLDSLDSQAVITRDTEKFFHELKKSALKGSFSKLISNIELAHQLTVAKKGLNKANLAGQTYRANQLESLIGVTPKIMQAVHTGFNRVININKLNRLINELSDEDVKVIDLPDYNADIPDEVAGLIKQLRDKHTFDRFLVVCTDYSEEDTKRIKLEQDPVLFGMIGDKENNYWYDQLFFVADWEDPYVGLTLQEMIEASAEKLLEKPSLKLHGGYDVNIKSN